MLSQLGPGRFLVRRADGSRALYDLRRWQHRELPADEPGPRDARHPEPGACVPTCCARCYAGTSWAEAPAAKHLARLYRRVAGCRAAVVGVANHIAGPGRAGGLAAEPRCRGDIAGAHVDVYYRHPGAAGTMFQPVTRGSRRGTLRYGHGVDAGQVLLYWHVHDGDSFYLCAAALITDAHSAKAAGDYLVDSTSSAALSLGNYAFGRDEVVSELSVVLVPGRAGCFADFVSDERRLAEALERHRYPAGRGDAGLLLRHVDAAARPPANSRDRVLELTLDMVARQRDILKLTKAHPCRSNTETYINCGLERYSEFTGVRPRLLTAAMQQQTGAPPGFADAVPSAASFQTQLANLGMHVIHKHLIAEATAQMARERAPGGGRRRARDASPDSDSSGDESRGRRRGRSRSPRARSRRGRAAREPAGDEGEGGAGAAAAAPKREGVTLSELKAFLTGAAQAQAIAPVQHSPPPLELQADLKRTLEDLSGRVREMHEALSAARQPGLVAAGLPRGSAPAAAAPAESVVASPPAVAAAPTPAAAAAAATTTQAAAPAAATDATPGSSEENILEKGVGKALRELCATAD